MQYWQYVGTIRFGFSSQRTANRYCVVDVTMVTMIKCMILTQNKIKKMKLISLTACLQALVRFFIGVQQFPNNATCVSPNHVISSFLIRLCLEFAWLHLGFAYIAHLGFSLLHIFHIWDLHISQNLGIAFIACLLTFIQSLVVLMVVILFEVMMAITRC